MNFQKIIIFSIILSSVSISIFGLNDNYSSISLGQKTDLNRKIYILDKLAGSNDFVSPFHDIPLWSKDEKDIVNMVVEIPKNAQEKIEINKSLIYNPLMHDIRDNKIRKVTYNAKKTKISGYPFHYGALPQTWEHSGILDKHTKLYGDNDPVDAFDISKIPAKVGDINKVKVLGAIAMIDNNETDWKLIVINIKDKISAKYDDIKDISSETMDIIYDFLLNYKTPEKKPQNKFFKKIYWDKKEAIDIIDELHNNWKKLCAEPQSLIKILKTNRPSKLLELPFCQTKKCH